jgi:hypothetical protein
MMAKANRKFSTGIRELKPNVVEKKKKDKVK